MIKDTSWTAMKVLLSVADPLQGLVDPGGVTHTFCNRQALNILFNDGWKDEAEFIGRYIINLNQGTCWADRGWKCFAHYLDTESGKGLGPWPDAAHECTRYVLKFLEYQNKAKWKQAFFFLGAAVHLVQDLCVPHHAAGIAFSGHQKYEKWVRCRYHQFAVYDSGLYDLAYDSFGWLYANGRKARDYLSLVGQKSSEQSYKEATAILLPLTQRTTAGFLLQCLQHFY